ncbi:MAG: Signal transduction histidine kinase [Caulobacteraceae bacterium]|nr:Signal transduction histidine kinase [Caulobacteraceae bacterium]
MAATPPDLIDSLALAVISASDAPLLLLDGEFNVVAASDSFHRVFQLDLAGTVGRPIFQMGGGEWDVPQLRTLLKATLSSPAPIKAYDMDLKVDGGPRRLVLKAHRLDYGDNARKLMVLAVSDVTQARLAEKLKDDLLREKAILLQEVQHRVANSLQIIASVLLQNARKVSSEETRAHLKDAHNRVMSVAALQHQLSASGLADVAVGPYFSQLCESLGASMIHDKSQLSIDVTVDDSIVESDVSVSLGLIVTELVINALKHAFPDRRRGIISVGYKSTGANWTLSVGDNGIGMPKDAASRKPGLGTSIVEALARQLNARVQVANGNPGTTVSIGHAQLALVLDV